MYFRAFLYLNVLLYINVEGKISKIVGGENADIQDFPYMASLRYLRMNRHFCGGTIISNIHILTAAHCVYNAESYYAEIIIYVGSSSSTATNIPGFRIQRVHIPNEYDITNKKSGDIAVITLQDYIVFNRFQNKIGLPTKDVQPGENGVVSGWGVTQHASQIPSQQLQILSMKVIEKSKCLDLLGPFNSNHNICAFQKMGVGVCIGDSGGPLVIDGKLAGISSFVVPCAKGFPDVYENVYTQLNFIQSIIKNRIYNISTL